MQEDTSILIGGRALACRLPVTFESRRDGDEDYFYLEGSEAPVGDSSEISHELWEKFSQASRVVGVATLSDLMAIKLSHLSYEINFWKHAVDVLHLQLLGIEPNRKLLEAFKEHWKDVHGGKKSHLSLYKTKDEFFDDFVPKKYEHDRLHDLISEDGTPVYTKCLVDGQEVLVCQEKFNALSFEDQIRMFKEEVAVIALERWVIPSEGRTPIGVAWRKSLMKTVTALTKGWASDFIIEHLSLFINPLKGDMERALKVLNEKEIYMKYSDFKDLVENCLDDATDSGVTWKWGYVPDVEEIILEGCEEAGIVLVNQKGGGEGGAEDCVSVLLIKGQHYAVYYSYYSHYGHDFNYVDVRKVSPKQKTITVYE